MPKHEEKDDPDFFPFLKKNKVDRTLRESLGIGNVLLSDEFVRSRALPLLKNNICPGKNTIFRE